MLTTSVRFPAVTAAGVMLLGAAPVGAQQIERSGGPPVLTVSASAEVSIQPDRAVVRLGALAEAEEAADAQNGVNETMQRVLDAMRELGVPESALRTEDLSLYPVYSNERPMPNRPAQEPRIIGYRASNVISVEVGELARIGEVIDAGISAGANQLQGISFRARNDAGARAEAMRLAVEEARLQADAVADALGVEIVGVREVVAGGYDMRPPQPYIDARELQATSVQPGQVEISANVTITYELGGPVSVD